MTKIRNAHQYRQALDRLQELATQEDLGGTLPEPEWQEACSLAAAADAYELVHAEVRDYVGRK